MKLLYFNFYYIILILLILNDKYLASKCDRLILTPYIESNQLDLAKQLSAVRNLPNASFKKIESYSGLLTVNKTYNSNLFFWFFPAWKNAESAPIILWLQGGTGNSVLTGLLNQNGPFYLQQKDEQLSLHLNELSWTQDFSMIYMDNPIGSGFSFTDDRKGFSKDQKSLAINLYEALKQFFSLFYEYNNNDFYVSGISYGGKYATAIGHELHINRDVSGINFKGMIIWAGFVDPINMIDYGPFLKTIGFIDDKQEKYFNEEHDKVVAEIENKNFLTGNEIISNLISFQEGKLSAYFNFTHRINIANFLMTNYEERMNYYLRYMNMNETRKAVHVFPMNLIKINVTTYMFFREDYLKSVKPWIETLINNNYKVLICAGNLDIITAVPLIENFIKKLDWKFSNEFYETERVIWKVLETDREIAGYVKSYANFTEVIILNAGHVAPVDQPRASADMLKRFINSQSFKNNP